MKYNLIIILTCLTVLVHGQALFMSNEELVADSIAEGIVLNSLPDGGTAKMLDLLIEKYPGKVLYIDLWATWCRPCIGDFTDAKKLKNKLKGEEVVFVYLAASSSNYEQWKRMIIRHELKGEHYFMDKLTDHSLSDDYNVRAIPHYLLINKKGEVVDKHAPRPWEVHRKIKRLLK